MAEWTCMVTGAAGFIGSHLSERLVREGYRVIGVDCFTDYYPRAVKERNVASLREDPRFTLVEADLRTATLEPLLSGVDVVFHNAAMPGLVRSWTEFEAYMTCNVLATQRLLEAARTTGVRHFIHASTSSVYGRDSSGDEERPTRPISPYGITKLAAENLVRAYGEEFGVPFTILRYFSIYGPRQRPDMGYHIFIRAMLLGEPITLFGDGEQSRGNTYVADCVEANLAALRHGPTNDIFNIGGGEEITLNELVARLERIIGRKAIIRRAPARPGEQRQALADISKARRLLGWEPRVSLEEGLKAQVEWQKAELGLLSQA
ncbi:MAG: NAD-dependent epimerase/dehydratase family protein [Anaerolineae bacterium]